MIKDIKVALRTKADSVYVSSISGSQQSFILNLSTQKQFLGSFQYKGNLWITLGNANVFGFVQLNHLPTSNFHYTGKWHLDKGCYTFPVTLQGLSSVKVNNTQLYPDTQLQIKLTGNLKTFKEQSDTCVIKRAETFLVNPLEEAQGYSGYVTSVNGFQCIALNITSSDSSILIQDLKNLTDNTYVLNIDTTKDFPTCKQQQRDESDSIQ